MDSPHSPNQSRVRAFCRYNRRRCLEALVANGKGGEEEALYRRELEYTGRVAAENPKNYQVWCVLASCNCRQQAGMCM